VTNLSIIFLFDLHILKPCYMCATSVDVDLKKTAPIVSYMLDRSYWKINFLWRRVHSAGFCFADMSPLLIWTSMSAAQGTPV
jgi:hypothetical protein